MSELARALALGASLSLTLLAAGRADAALEPYQMVPVSYTHLQAAAGATGPARAHARAE